MRDVYLHCGMVDQVTLLLLLCSWAKPLLCAKEEVVSNCHKRISRSKTVLSFDKTKMSKTFPVKYLDCFYEMDATIVALMLDKQLELLLGIFCHLEPFNVLQS